ncbi:MAG: ketopantoate reductase family protein, partial [Holdemanella sp.]|nr:ketopantoate reductase family protein [Holdemanella sp.]
MKKVCLIGAGAIGCYFIWAFDKKYPLSVIATGKRKEKLEKG